MTNDKKKTNNKTSNEKIASDQEIDINKSVIDEKTFIKSPYFEEIKKIENKLKNYIIGNFDIKHDKILRKFEHTFKVVSANNKIISSLNLSDRENYISTIIALFHDYARFIQIKTYDSFNDHATRDHADWAIELLFDNNELDNFVTNLTGEEKEIIRLAIKNHNKFSIEEGLTESQNMFCKIIRDADKLDIFRIASEKFSVEKYNIGLLLDEDIKNFYDHKIYRTKKEVDFYSHVICFLSFIYDINFKKSFEILATEQYIKKLMYLLLLECPEKISAELKEMFLYAQKYVEDKSK